MGEDGASPSPQILEVSVRLRPLATLSIAAAAVVLLAGCSGAGGAPADSASPSASAAGDLCAAAAPSGAASDAVTVDGAPGTESTAAFTFPLDIPELQRTVVSEGSGDPVQSGQLISYALSAFNADTGEKLGAVGYAESEILPAPITADSPLGQVIGCATPGSRVVATFPASENGPGEVYVFDFLEIVPDAAWGEPQTPEAGLPTVTLADDGTPTIEVPKTDPPTSTEVSTLKKGDGAVVESGDQVLIQFRGARWSSGELFDGGDTWASGTPYTGATTGFVPGFTKALEGQTVGSQVLVVITPADGYGEGEINETDLKGDTLVFVIDILGAQHPQAQ